jgi:hypothetical protein
MRFHHRCLRKALGICQPRKRGEVFEADFPTPVVRDLTDRERLDFHPLASHQQHKGAISTHRLLVCSRRRLGELLLETLLLTLTLCQPCLPYRQGGAPRCRFAHPHSQQVLEQLLR